MWLFHGSKIRNLLPNKLGYGYVDMKIEEVEQFTKNVFTPRPRNNTTQGVRGRVRGRATRLQNKIGLLGNFQNFYY